MAEEPRAVDFNEVLHYDPATGVITHRGTRVLVTGTGHLGALRKYLLASYSPDEIREKYWKSGYDQGFGDVLSIAKTIDISEDFDFVKLGSAMAGMTGAALTTIEKVNFSLVEGRVSVRARFHHSHEAIEYLRQIGPSKSGVCWTRCGYAQGFLEGILDTPVHVLEAECLAMGDASCLFTITTDPKEAAEAAAGLAARATQGTPAPAPPVAGGALDEGPALSHERIHELATHFSPRDKERLVDYFARRDAELERSRLRYRALLDASPDVVLEVSHEGAIMLANESARTLLGRDPHGLIGEKLPSLFLAEDRAAVANLLATLAPGPTVVFSRLRFLDAVGQVRVAELAVRVMEGGAGGATNLVEIRDVTDRVQLEAQIVERESRRRAVFDGAADGIVVWGEDGRITDANLSAEKMLGFKPGELKGVFVDEVLLAIKAPARKAGKKGPHRAAKLRRVSVRSLRAKRWVGDGEIQPRRGDIRPAILTIARLQSGQPKGSHIGLIKDRSDLEALREELRVEKGRTDAIVEAISEPMVVFNERGEVEWHNAHAEFVFGRRKVVSSTPCHLLVCDRHEPCAECPLAQFAMAAHNPGTVRSRRPMRTTDGGVHPFELTFRRLPNPGEAPHSLVVFRDLAQEAGSQRAIAQRLERDDLHLEVSDLLLSSRALPEMLARFADRVTAELDLSLIGVLLKRSDDWLEPMAVFHGPALVEGVPQRIPASNTGLKDVLVHGQTRIVRDTDKSASASSLIAVLEREGAAASNSLLLSPMATRLGAVNGVLVAGRSEVDAFDDDEVELWEGIASRLGLALDGVLLAEANQRVLKLQEALIAEAEVLMSSGDWTKNAMRFLEVLCDSVGAPSAGLVYRYATRDAVRLFLSFSPSGGDYAGPSPPVPLRSSPLLSRREAPDEVQVIDIRTLLKHERDDPVLGPLITEKSETLVLVPSGVKGHLTGWIVVTLPAGFHISTPSEVDALRNLGQQSQLALSALLAAGRLDTLRELLERDDPAAT